MPGAGERSAFGPKQTKFDFGRDGLSANDPKRTSGMTPIERWQHNFLLKILHVFDFSQT